MLALPLAYIAFAPPTGMRIEGSQILAQGEGSRAVSTLYRFEGTIEDARDSVRKALSSDPAWEERTSRDIDGMKIQVDPYWVLKGRADSQFMLYRNAIVTVGSRRYPGVIGVKTEPSHTPAFLADLRTSLRPNLHLELKN